MDSATQNVSPHYDVEMSLNVPVPMRDGVNLSADLYLPRAEGRFPTVLIRTPYSNNSDGLIWRGRALANLGFACVIQDCRGRWDSDGDFTPFVNEAEDGYDTQEWVGQQTWSNGKIGTSGGSYLGMTQWLTAPLNSQYLTCMTPSVTCTNLFEDIVYVGGAFQLGVMMMWGMGAHGHTGQNVEHHNWTEAFLALPLRAKATLAGREIDYWRDWVEHSTYDDYWTRVNVSDKWDQIQVPALNIGGWYDLWAQQTFTNFNGLRQYGATPEAKQSRLVVGPWVHAINVSPRVGDIDFGMHSMLDLETLELRWLDYWLRGNENGIAGEAPLHLFIMGANEWRDEQEWPLARTDWKKWYFHSQGKANTLRGEGFLSPEEPGDEPTDHFVYDPRYPVQTCGGNTCCSPHIVPWGPYDQRSVEMRSDVLCYTSEPLPVDTEITGPIKVVLYAATDVPDTDWTAKLVDVAPSGYAKNLCDGILRARYRKSMVQPSLLEPNQIYKYEIDVGVTGNLFRQGHSIRLEISSSNFPRFARNLNTGANFGTDTEMQPAHQTIYHSRSYPSHVILPVIPQG
ncbi:CocE/NonD family hydrolase [Chloroflexi bacterium TSY]|nr:CocE/NonD family hydrolase [Chloroflexi bacterium TSY]